MLKYAIVEEILEKKKLWIYNPWILKGAKFFSSFSQVPSDFIIVAHYPAWLEPLKTWKDQGKKFIELEWGYWGEKSEGTKSRIMTYRASYCHSHNIRMKSVPYSRINTLKPSPHAWRQQRGDTLLLIEPHPEWIVKRTGLTFSQWKEGMLAKVLPHWSGPIRWREKRGGAKKNRTESFINDLSTSYAVVGERTMACVEAVMYGVPAYTVDYSAVTPLMGSDLSVLKNPILPDRTQWFEHIAWSQFHRTEFDQGTLVADSVELYQILK